ncbi:hypothetical protein E2C01_099543 [Portunus trituberculatus]|uniref:Uncharacterized protein n=1 Tax=Portunus trituberculatus TaxID=210409 RepID=A0A5B7KH40_PORTR|nr:hypothetical protein [Portunus trituberculatus]
MFTFSSVLAISGLLGLGVQLAPQPRAPESTSTRKEQWNLVIMALYCLFSYKEQK